MLPNSQAKKQKPLPPSELTEEDIENMGDKEFKKLIIQLLTNKEKCIMQEFKQFKEFVIQERNQMKAAISEVKNTLEQIKITVENFKIE